MLSQLERLSVETDGRYASDKELVFFQQYLQTARLRFALYQKLQRLEPHVVQEVLGQLRRQDPTLLQVGGQDLTPKWQRDTVRTLRYGATAMLLDDPDHFKEQMLLWFQTIMRSFHTERSCDATYRILQTVMQQYLTSEEGALFLPILELSRTVLAGSSGLDKP